MLECFTFKPSGDCGDVKCGGLLRAFFLTSDDTMAELMAELVADRCRVSLCMSKRVHLES